MNNLPSDIISSPLDQFEIRNLLSLDAPVLANLHISLTNIGLYLTIAAFITLSLNLAATNYNKVVANNRSLSQESIYATIHSIVVNQINANKRQIYFPFIYALYTFTLINNLIGLVPSTSQFVLAFSVRFTVVLGATIHSIVINQINTNKGQVKYLINMAFYTIKLILASIVFRCILYLASLLLSHIGLNSLTISCLTLAFIILLIVYGLVKAKNKLKYIVKLCSNLLILYIFWH